MSLKFQKTFFLILTIFAGILILIPFLNFQYFLSQGDHGRDLYCFQKTMEGALPYRDYSWLFGPLMPFYYSFIYTLFGISIQSVLLGQNILIFITGFLIYSLCTKFMSRPFSFLTATTYWIFRDIEFFYTYNHSGALLAIILSLYFLVKYIECSKNSYIYGLFLSLFLLMHIRLNIGIATLFGQVICLLICDHTKGIPNFYKRIRFYISLSLLISLITFLIHFLLLRPLPLYAIRQCFPWGKTQRTDSTATISDAFFMIFSIIKMRLFESPPNLFLGVLWVLSLLQFFILMFKKAIKEKIKMFSIIFSLLFLLIVNSHEFLLSGVYYRIFWIFPFLTILFFLFIDIATKSLPRFFRTLLILCLGIIVFSGAQKQHVKVESFKTPEHLLSIGKNRIYTMQNQDWLKPIHEAVAYLKEHVKKEETILVMPLDPLYLFLSERNSSTRQLVFFEHIQVGEEQQQKIIRELQDEKANWLILSNRSRSNEPGLGSLGETYCVTLGQYLLQNFEFKAQFGDWTHPPGWAWNHGVRIFKKKSQ